MEDNVANPHVVVTGHVYNDQRHDQIMEELTGKPKEVRQKEFKNVFESFKERLENFVDKLRAENAILRAKLAKYEAKYGNIDE
jgi:hypothetical protein